MWFTKVGYSLFNSSKDFNWDLCNFPDNKEGDKVDSKI